MYRYYLRETVVGDGRRPARTLLAQAQEEAAVPAGRWRGRGLAVLGLAAGDVVIEARLRNLFGEGRHPHADRIEVDQLAAGKKPAAARRAEALGRRVKVTGFDLTFRPQPTLTLLWALGDEETRGGRSRPRTSGLSPPCSPRSRTRPRSSASVPRASQGSPRWSVGKEVGQHQGVTAAIFTACASIVVAVLAFLLSQHSQIRQERRQARLMRVNSQLQDLYGPLNTLLVANEEVWEALRGSVLPGRDERNPESGTAEWRRWRDHVLMPVNRRMRDLVVEHADLIIEVELPKPLIDFCAHVLSLEIVIAEEADGLKRRALIPHPGSEFATYVHSSFLHLKRQQQLLLGPVS